MGRIRSENPDAGVVDDKIAEARERIGRIEKSAAPMAEVEKDTQDTEDRAPERQEAEEGASDDAHVWRD
jgi:hypothetical protein